MTPKELNICIVNTLTDSRVEEDPLGGYLFTHNGKEIHVAEADLYKSIPDLTGDHKMIDPILNEFTGDLAQKFYKTLEEIVTERLGLAGKKLTDAEKGTLKVQIILATPFEKTKAYYLTMMS